MGIAKEQYRNKSIMVFPSKMPTTKELAEELCVGCHTLYSMKNNKRSNKKLMLMKLGLLKLRELQAEKGLLG